MLEPGGVHGHRASRLRDVAERDLQTLLVRGGQPVITIWGADDFSALRAYDAGSDHHLPAATGYLVVRAVVDVLARRTFTREQLQIGPLRIDVAAHTVDIDDGTAVALTRREFELLHRLAGDPARVFTKNELVHAVWDAVTPSAHARSTATSAACARTSPPPAPTGCCRTAGASDTAWHHRSSPDPRHHELAAVALRAAAAPAVRHFASRPCRIRVKRVQSAAGGASS